MASKPRTTRSKRPKNSSPSKPTKQSEPSESGLFNNALNAVGDLSVLQKLGLGISAAALLSTAFVSFGSSSKSGKNAKSLTPGGPGGRRGKLTEIEPWKSKSPIKRKGKGKGKKDAANMVSTAQVTKAFQTCLGSKRPQQQLIADEFFAQIKRWSSDQLEVDGQTIVVNFLFWYYRSANVPSTRFQSEQAEHIRYWANYAITNDLKWDYYNIKFDYLYSTALLQQSVPHMKQFYNWICSETPRSAPEDASSRKPNYHLTKYQASCILGDWKGTKSVGQTLKALQSNSGTSGAATTRSDYFMHYTLRALELPSSNPNFGLMYKIVDKLEVEFPALDLPPPRFGSWQILSFKYRNSEAGGSYLQDQDFVFASDKIKGDDGWYTFYPQESTMTSRIPKKVHMWGRVCQMVSPVFGAAGFLPLTGSWSDTKLYMQTNWTFRGTGNRLTRKHVIMRCERLPVEQEVESKDFFGKTKTEKGYLWRGHLTIHMKKLPKGVTIRNLYDDEGEDYFDGEAAIRQKQELNAKKAEEEEQDVKGNGAVEQNDGDQAVEAAGSTETAGKEVESSTEKPKEPVKEEAVTETQVYELELVISKENAVDKSKEMTKAILSKMRNSPNALSSAQVLRE